MNEHDLRRLEAPGRLDEIDLLRGVAISAVVALHVSWKMLTPESLASAGGAAVAVVHLAAGFGVPLFVALSVFGLLLGHGGAFGGAGNYAAFLAQRARRLLPAYLFWSLLSIAAGDASRLARPLDVAAMLAAGTADIQFYFVPMIFELYVLWPLLRPLLVRAVNRSGALAVAVFALAFTGLAWSGAMRASFTSLAMFAPWIAAGALAHSAFAGLRGAGFGEGDPAAGADVGHRQVFTRGFEHAAVVRGSEPVPEPGSPSPPRRGVARAWWVPLVASMLAAASLGAVVLSFRAETSSSSAGRETMLLAALIFRWPAALYAAAVMIALATASSTLLRGAIGLALVALGRASYGIFLAHLLVASSVVWRLFDFDAATRSGFAAASFGFLAAWGLTIAGSYAITRALGFSPRTSWTVGGH
jgi:peptidoglycan/LPS O-acetylase OafA/YrhL